MSVLTVLPSSQPSVPSTTVSPQPGRVQSAGQFAPGPSSQFSSGKPVAFSTTPSPQTGVVQSEGQASPLAVLPSSQVSRPSIHPLPQPTETQETVNEVVSEQGPASEASPSATVRVIVAVPATVQL